jgi:hypothetical protein
LPRNLPCTPNIPRQTRTGSEHGLLPFTRSIRVHFQDRQARPNLSRPSPSFSPYTISPLPLSSPPVSQQVWNQSYEKKYWCELPRALRPVHLLPELPVMPPPVLPRRPPIGPPMLPRRPPIGPPMLPSLRGGAAMASSDPSSSTRSMANLRNSASSMVPSPSRSTRLKNLSTSSLEQGNPRARKASATSCFESVPPPSRSNRRNSSSAACSFPCPGPGVRNVSRSAITPTTAVARTMTPPIAVDRYPTNATTVASVLHRRYNTHAVFSVEKEKTRRSGDRGGDSINNVKRPRDA